MQKPAGEFLKVVRLLKHVDDRIIVGAEKLGASNYADHTGITVWWSPTRRFAYGAGEIIALVDAKTMEELLRAFKSSTPIEIVSCPDGAYFKSIGGLKTLVPNVSAIVDYEFLAPVHVAGIIVRELPDISLPRKLQQELARQADKLGEVFVYTDEVSGVQMVDVGDWRVIAAI